MTIVSVMGRPIKVFDPTDKVHRENLSSFLKTGSWKDSPFRFVASEPTEVDVGTMTRQLVEYYTEKEFSKKVDKQ